MDTTNVARATSALGWNLLRNGTDANRVIAPSTLAVTLGMLAEGATEAALESLDAVLGTHGGDRATELATLRNELATYDTLPERIDVDDPPASPVVHQASQVVLLGGRKAEQDFLDRLAAHYGAVALEVSHAEAKDLLDAWVNAHTAGLIESSGVTVDPQVELVVQDAILFAAAWQRRFTHDDTPLEFAGPDGPQRVEALSGQFQVPYAQTDGWRAVRLPYDEALAMDLVLPAAGNSPQDLDDSVLEDVRLALDEAHRQPVAVTVGPVDLTQKWELAEPLRSLGVRFDDSLDGIFPDAAVDQVVQQVRLMTSAKGTVGAAVTEVAIRAMGLPVEPVTLTFDRPFVMRVLDTRTGWPFFLAIVSDAAAAAGSR